MRSNPSNATPSFLILVLFVSCTFCTPSLRSILVVFLRVIHGIKRSSVHTGYRPKACSSWSSCYLQLILALELLLGGFGSAASSAANLVGGRSGGFIGLASEALSVV